LGIIGIRQYILLIFRYKYLSDLSSHFQLNWYVLQIRLCAADSSRSSNSLVKAGVYPASSRINYMEEPFGICGF
jgi:hypothetical protein